VRVGDDRVDRGALEVMLEGGHARRSLADEAADDLIAAAGRVYGQQGAKGSRVDLRRQVANPAGLGENLAAQFLRGGQSIVGLLRRRAPHRQRAQEDGRANGQENGRANRGAALHLGSSRHRFFTSLRRRGAERKARPRTRRLDRHAFRRGYRRRSSDARPGTRATGRLKRERASAHGPQNTKRPRGATRAAFLVSRPVALTTVVPTQ